MGNRVMLTLRKEDKRIPGTSRAGKPGARSGKRGIQPGDRAGMYLCKHRHTHETYTQMKCLRYTAKLLQISLLMMESGPFYCILYKGAQGY